MCDVRSFDRLLLQERKRSKAAQAAEAAAAARVPLTVRMNESVTTGMTRALDSSNKVIESASCGEIRCMIRDLIAGICNAGEDGLEERGTTPLTPSLLPCAVLLSRSFAVQDGGLGSSVRGAAEPITVSIKRTREGLGCSSEATLVSSAASSASASEAMLQGFRSSYLLHFAHIVAIIFIIFIIYKIHR